MKTTTLLSRFAVKVSALLLLLLITFSAVSCSAVGIKTPDGMRLCSDESLEYCFFVPTGWILNTQSGSTSAYYSLDDPASVSVTAYSPEVSLDIDGYWDLCEAEYEKEFKNYAFLSEEATTVAEKNAKEYVYTADFSEKTYKFSQTIFVHNSMFYVITYTALEDNFDAHLADVAEMKAEFLFR